MTETVHRKAALIIVDVQNDFVSGSLAVPGGEKVVQACNDLRHCAPFSKVILTQDWHPPDHISFASSSGNYVLCDGVQREDVREFSTVSFSTPALSGVTLYPQHCIQDTPGAALHPQLESSSQDVVVRKGTNAEREAYSAFSDNQQVANTHLESTLRENGITDVFCCGLAYEICVAWTARDAVRRGFATYFVENAAAGVDMQQMSAMKEELVTLGVQFVASSQVPQLVNASPRHLKIS